MSRQWRRYADERPTAAGVYEWRVPSVAIPGLVVRFVAHMRKRGAGLGTALSPAFDYWDGYRLHVPAGTEWRECEQISLAEYSYGNLSIEGLAFAPCIYCRRTPTLMGVDRSGGSVAIKGEPHHYNSWWLECCQWGATPHLSDPREIEAVRRKVFGRADAELADALRDLTEAVRAYVDDSEGIVGWHRNGDIEPWGATDIPAALAAAGDLLAKVDGGAR